MSTAPRLSILFPALAGFVDALGFASLGFFPASIGATTVRGFAGPGLPNGATGLAMLLSFVAGVMVVSILGHARPQQAASWTLLVAALLLAGSALLDGTTVLLPLAAAMGSLGTLGGLPHLPAVLVRLGQRLTAALVGERDRWGWLTDFSLWAGFAGGAVMGAMGYSIWGMRAALFAAVVAALASLSAAQGRSHSR